MLNETINHEDYYFTDSDGSKLLAKGMSLICHYYRKKHHLNNMFSVGDYNEVSDLILRCKRNNNRFGIVYVNTIKGRNTSTHNGSIVVDGDQAFIVDSLGDGVGSGAQALKEYLIQENLFKAQDVYISSIKIQRDCTSCGTLSFLFIKEALRMGNTFKEFMISNADWQKKIDNLPPNLIKYMQSISEIKEKHQQNVDDYSFYPEMPVKKQNHSKKTETLLDYVARNKKTSPKNPGKEISIAASRRAEKHIRIINELLMSSTALKEVENEMDRVNSLDYSEELLGNTQVIFEFTPEHKKKIISSKISDKSSECGSDFDVFNWLAANATPPPTPPRLQNGSNTSTPTKTTPQSLREISSISRRLMY